MIEQQKAEAYVREKLPELMELSFGCLVRYKGGEKILHAVTKSYKSKYTGGHWDFVKIAEKEDVENGVNLLGLEILGHPIQLQHWLRVLKEDADGHCILTSKGLSVAIMTKREGFSATGYIKFNLTTGQPATESDYKAFNDIIST